MCKINKWHSANLHELAGTIVGKQTRWQPANHCGGLGASITRVSLCI